MFSQEVYIKEIVDIRDTRMHWTAADEDAVDPASIALPASPMVRPSFSRDDGPFPTSSFL